MVHYDESTAKCQGGDEVAVTFTSTVAPALPLEEHRLPLSNLDLILPPIDVSVFFCYAAGEDYTAGTGSLLALTLKTALAKVLVAYYPLAGEVVANAAGEPELLCSGRGVDYVEAAADGVELREVRLGLPDESVEKLVPKKMSGVMSVQVRIITITSFMHGASA
ncbi:hypothetical protein ZWY2020_013408 [Hordeum vulgare]|nr:hypothetical protein ZWY2020_013408 [Hordeum vulgare]